MARIVVVEDNATLRETLADLLRAVPHDVQAVETAEEAWKICAAAMPDLVLSDLKLPGESGIELLGRLKGQDPLVEVLLLTGYGTVETAVAAMRGGAFDFLTKPVRMDQLLAKVQQALAVRRDRLALLRERERRAYLEEEVGEAHNAGEIVGRSTPMKRLFATIAKVAPTASSVLITGERARARNSLRGRSTPAASAARDRSCACIAAHCQRACSRASSSDTRRERSPERCASGGGASSWPSRGPSS